MRKYAALLFALILTAFNAGCGGNKTSAAATTTGTVLSSKVSLTAADVTGKTLYATAIDATSLAGYLAYQINANGTALVSSAKVTNGAPVLDHNGAWSIAAGGLLVLTDTTAVPNVQHQFTCIQKETSYWLVYDETNRISRFYFNQAAAQAYLGAVTISQNKARVGGSAQGTALALSQVSTFAGTAGTPGLADGTGQATAFRQPNGITTDGANLYVADYLNNMIRKIVIASQSVTRFAGNINGIAGYANSTDGTGDSATFNLPDAITTDGTSLFVADTGNHTIRRIDISTGVVTLLAGIAGSAGSADSTDGTGTTARFNQPKGITTDGSNLYVADYGNHTIRKVVISSGAVVTLAGGAGSAGSADSTDGTGATARFNLPKGITTDGTYLYVTDFKNATIRRIVIATGNVTTIAGTAASLGSSDGTGSAARFNQPNGITTDGTNLYVTDSFFNTIRMIVISSKAVTTIAGNASSPTGAVNGSGAVATFDTPIGITTDGVNLYVTDSGNHLIRKIQ